ncbi:hypothetical protein DV515_00007939 [Chloebia gouldiae]|uniref:Uncharacterized protein n=1 Tax=Chloebia gouldiae TaxID=44316 RepID=A0A3L8SG98_CHLGU|nr:hypothetical protein DV515_00007939 [Chloebia gouldiae]
MDSCCLDSSETLLGHDVANSWDKNTYMKLLLWTLLTQGVDDVPFTQSLIRGTTSGKAKGTEDRMCSGSKEITFKHEPASCKGSLFLTSVSLSRA